MMAQTLRRTALPACLALSLSAMTASRCLMSLSVSFIALTRHFTKHMPMRDAAALLTGWQLNPSAQVQDAKLASAFADPSRR